MGCPGCQLAWCAGSAGRGPSGLLAAGWARVRRCCLPGTAVNWFPAGRRLLPFPTNAAGCWDLIVPLHCYVFSLIACETNCQISSYFSSTRHAHSVQDELTSRRLEREVLKKALISQCRPAAAARPTPQSAAGACNKWRRAARLPATGCFAPRAGPARGPAQKRDSRKTVLGSSSSTHAVSTTARLLSNTIGWQMGRCAPAHARKGSCGDWLPTGAGLRHAALSCVRPGQA